MKQSANGIEINYVIEGDGPVVTMSHSLACNLSMWDEQVRALRERYRVLRFDTRGHGQTSAPPGPYSLDQLADDLHGLLSGLGIERTHFVGLSMGGMIGQVFALKRPTMVESLVLCDTTSRHCPALVIVGEEDPGTPVEMAREIHAALPGAELAILRSASHLSNLEQPDEFNRVLARFLDKVTGRSTL